MCEGLVEDIYSKLKMEADNYRLEFNNMLDWEVSEVSFTEMPIGGKMGNMYSTPIVNRTSRVGSDDGRVNSKFEETVSGKFLQWIEQSIGLQEELLEVLDEEGDRLEDKASSMGEFSGFHTAASFSGFELQVDFQNQVKREVLRRMREQLMSTRRGVQGFRSSNGALRQIW